ncbi:MAG TPA: hypothetical protein VMM36_02330 [Opitutaceae bacterium]|nr:hypothetical protein [Opitutaceae bacterium]
MAETPGQDPRRFRLHDFLPALKAGVLVGGQAVNLWAEVYRARIPERLEPFAPFVSKDCDLHFRTRHEPEVLAREVGWRFVATEGVGQILGRLQHESGAIIEILAGIRTAIADQIEREAVDGALAGQVVRVLNPASMLREKVSLAVEANQTGRQDAKHVEILAPCCRCFFEDLAAAVTARELTGRDAIFYLNIALEVLRSRNARHFDAIWGTQWTNVIPWTALTATNDPALGRFARHQSPS